MQTLAYPQARCFMFNLLIDWFFSAIALLIVTYVVPGFQLSGFGAALIAAIAVGLVNATIGIVLKVLTFPLTILTLGIFWLIINALMLRLAAAFVPGFSITGFWPAFFGAIVLSVVNVLLGMIKRGLQEERQP
jgi:putative membrane protein